MTEPTSGSRWKHKQRGTTYRVIGVGRVQCPGDSPLRDDEMPLLYQDTTSGDYGIRRPAEFLDGRFEQVADEPAGKPTPEAVRLMHKLRTYGHKTEFAVPDAQAACNIDAFARAAVEPWQRDCADITACLANERKLFMERLAEVRAAVIEEMLSMIAAEWNELRGRYDAEFDSRARDGLDRQSRALTFLEAKVRALAAKG